MNFSPEAKIVENLHPELAVGIILLNPVTEQPNKVTFLGDHVYRFYLKANRERSLPYEALEGSEQYAMLANDPRFEGELAATEPSVELQWLTDMEDRRIVVSMKEIETFKPVK
jgi:hypothetical protein